MATQPTPRSGALSDRATATLVGVLFLTGTVAGVTARVVTGVGPEGPDYLVSAASMGDRLAAGALLVLVMGLALASIPVVVFPVLTVVSQRLALGYLVFRGALETIAYILTAVSWLALDQLARDHTADGADAGGRRASGATLAKVAEISGTSSGTIVFLIGATMFYWALLRSRLVPRWLSGWGLVAVIPYLAYALLATFGHDSSTTQALLDAPLGLQEMVLALWLIVRGFNRTATAPPSIGEGAPGLRPSHACQ
jgi:hypothetical protein